MKIGYVVQGAADEAFLRGLKRRWCPHAELVPGIFRGKSRESLRRELRQTLHDLRDHHGCEVLVILTDCDTNPWRDVKKSEWSRVPDDCRHMSVFGVADRNIECWLASDRSALARVLQCDPQKVPLDDPAAFVKRLLKLTERGPQQEKGKERLEQFVADAPLDAWLRQSESFAAFYEDVRDLAQQRGCTIENLRD